MNLAFQMLVIGIYTSKAPLLSVREGGTSLDNGIR